LDSCIMERGVCRGDVGGLSLPKTPFK
jgi:hypothetical protein